MTRDWSEPILILAGHWTLNMAPINTTNSELSITTALASSANLNIAILPDNCEHFSDSVLLLPCLWSGPTSVMRVTIVTTACLWQYPGMETIAGNLVTAHPGHWLPRPGNWNGKLLQVSGSGCKHLGCREEKATCSPAKQSLIFWFNIFWKLFPRPFYSPPIITGY